MIEGENASAANPYIQCLRLNGKPDEHTWNPHEIFKEGVTLQFDLGPSSNREWGSKPEDAPA